MVHIETDGHVARGLSHGPGFHRRIGQTGAGQVLQRHPRPEPGGVFVQFPQGTDAPGDAHGPLLRQHGLQTAVKHVHPRPPVLGAVHHPLQRDAHRVPLRFVVMGDIPAEAEGQMHAPHPQMMIEDPPHQGQLCFHQGLLPAPPGRLRRLLPFQTGGNAHFKITKALFHKIVHRIRGVLGNGDSQRQFVIHPLHKNILSGNRKAFSPEIGEESLRLSKKLRELERATARSNFQSCPAACTVGTGRFLRRKIPFSRAKIVSLQFLRPEI